jgi:hypothetical protein
MKRSTASFVLLLGAAGLLLGTCGKKNPSDNDGGNNGQTTETYQYTVLGNTLRVSIPLQVDTARYCDQVSGNLVALYDTTPAHIRIYSYLLAGDYLTIRLGDSAVFSRSGSGSGLPGTWNAVDTVEDFPVQMVFTDSTVAFTLVPAPRCWADSDYVRYQWPQDSADYRLTLNRVSCTEVRLIGDSTHETVTLTWNSSGNMTVAGSAAGHSAHTWYRNPTTCPNSLYPDWYYDYFLSPNARN